MAAKDSRVLLDLLQSLTSCTQWCCAELWMPLHGRLVVEAFWARTDESSSSSSFSELEAVTQSLALLPGVCIPGRVWNSMERAWVQDVTSEATSPRSHIFHRAGLVSSVCWPVKYSADTEIIGIISLFSRQRAEVNEDHITSLEALSMCSLPFLEHFSLCRGKQQANETQNEDHGAFNVDLEDGKPKVRNQVKYKTPFRDAQTIPRKAKFQERPVACMIQLKTSLQKFPLQSEGLPNPTRTAICWNMLEQLCELIVPWSDVLSQIRDELKPSLFSDDLMSSDDGLSLVKVPYVVQIPMVVEQSKKLTEKVSQCMDEIRRLSFECSMSKDREAKSLGEIETLKRRLFLSQRRLVKKNLNTFLERKSIAAKIRKELVNEIETLHSKLKELEKTLAVEKASGSHSIVLPEADADLLRLSLQSLAVKCPPMMACLKTEPIPIPNQDAPHPSLPSQETELHALRKQLLILRNASLTEFESKHRLTFGNESLLAPHRADFVQQMNELQTEIDALDQRISLGFNPPHYELMDPREVIAARKESQRAAATASAFENMQGVELDVETLVRAKRFDTVSSHESKEEQDIESTEIENEDEKKSDWTEKELHNTVRVNIWRGYNLRCKTKREMWRKLGKVELLNLVYQVFEYKANADVATQRSFGANFTTTERAFYRFLETRYGSKDVANLAAFDILKGIEEHRDHVKMFQLFAMAMTGGWYDADWKYILRCQQFVMAVSPQGFANLAAVETFLHRYLYRDAEQPEIQRFIKGFAVFPSYNRQLARCKQNDLDESVSAEMFAEYIAHLLYMNEEPKIRKVEIMYGVAKMDQYESISYDQFEAFAALCIPVERDISVSQLYYRMLTKAHPITKFPARSLIHSVAACELETLMAYHSCSRELEISLMAPMAVETA